MDVHNINGKANAGLTTGIIGSSLGALSVLGNGGMGLLGGLFGNGCGNMNCSENMLVNRYELGQAQEIESLKSQLSLRDASTYTDQRLLELYKYIDGKLGEVNGVLCGQAVQNQATKDSFQLMQERLDCCKNDLHDAICREASDRKCSDTAIINYVNATFYPKMISDISTAATSTAQTVYNPLPVCGCGC